MTEAERIERELRPAIMADPTVAELTAILTESLPADIRDLVLSDYTCEVRRATVAAMLATKGGKESWE